MAECRRLLADAHRALTEPCTVQEAKQRRDMVRALEICVREAKNTELQELATDVRLRWEIRAGEILDGMEKARGGQVNGRHGKDGSREKPSNRPPTLKEIGITKIQSARWQALSRMSTEEQEAKIAAAKFRATQASTSAPVCTFGSARRHRMGRHGAQNDERYTPAKYVAAVRDVLGTIDLDPASCDIAQRTVRARRYYTKEHDGLKQPWHGAVFLNPPYYRALITAFIAKLLADFKAGRVTEAILLTNSDTSTRWWHEAFGSCSAACFTKSRIWFEHKSEGEPPKPLFGSTFFHFGDRPHQFAKVFSRHGCIIGPWVFQRRGNAINQDDEQRAEAAE